MRRNGPNGFCYYWHDLRKDKKLFSTCQQGGNSIMVWAAFCSNGKSELCFIDSSMNSLVYLQTLQAHLLPFMLQQLPGAGVFQQDKASVHTSKVSKAWFKEHAITLLDWPPKSPDLKLRICGKYLHVLYTRTEIGSLRALMSSKWH